MDKLRLISSRHHNHIRQAAEIGDIKRARMCCAISAHETSAVNRKDDFEILQCHVVDELIVAAL